MRKLIYFLSKVLLWLSGLALILMMLHVTADVASKYLFNAPVPGTAEVVAAYYMISVVFLPLAYVEIANRSIVVEMIYDLLPSAAKYPLDIIGTLISLAFFGFLAYLGIGLAEEAYAVREYVDGLWRIVVWPSRFLIPLGMTVASLALMLRLVDLLRGQRMAAHNAPEGFED